MCRYKFCATFQYLKVYNLFESWYKGVLEEHNRHVLMVCYYPIYYGLWDIIKSLTCSGTSLVAVCPMSAIWWNFSIRGNVKGAPCFLWIHFCALIISDSFVFEGKHAFTTVFSWRGFGLAFYAIRKYKQSKLIMVEMPHYRNDFCSWLKLFYITW